MNDIYMCSERPEEEVQALHGALTWRETLSCMLETFLRQTVRMWPRRPPALLLVFLWPCGLRPWQRRDPYFSVVERMLERYAAALPLMAIDMHTVLRAHISASCVTPAAASGAGGPSTCEDTPELARALRATDGCHPSPWTHGAIARALFDALRVVQARAGHEAGHRMTPRAGRTPRLPQPTCRALRDVPEAGHAVREAMGCPPWGHSAVNGALNSTERRSCNATLTAILRLREAHTAASFLAWRPSDGFEAVMRHAGDRTLIPGAGKAGDVRRRVAHPQHAWMPMASRGSPHGAHASHSGTADMPDPRIHSGTSGVDVERRPLLLLPRSMSELLPNLRVSAATPCGRAERRIDCKIGLRVPCCGQCIRRPAECALTFDLRPSRQPTRRLLSEHQTALRVHGGLWKIGVASRRDLLHPVQSGDVLVVATEAVVDAHGRRITRRRVLSEQSVSMHAARCARTLDLYLQGVGKDQWWLARDTPANLTSVSICTREESSLGKKCPRWSTESVATLNTTSPKQLKRVPYSAAYLHYMALFY